MVTIAPARPVLGAPAAPAQPLAARAGAPPRDRFLDLVRIAAMVLVVAQHWLMPILAVDGGAIVLERANVLESVWPATWVTQVMPLVFFASGAATVLSLRGGATADRGWVSRRLVRLVGGVIVLAGVWLPLPAVLLASGLDPEVVSTGGRLIGGLLWFLVVLVILTALTPALLRLADRFRGAEVGVLAVAAVAVDVLRFGLGWSYVGYLNAVFVWAAVYVIGIHHARGRMGRLRGGRAALVGVLGFGVLGAAVALGPYPPAMIGLPGTAVSNMNPPSAALLALAIGQIAVLLAARGTLTRLANRPRVARFVDTWAPRTMAVYLWHTPAVVLVAATVVGLGLPGFAVGSTGWWLSVPVWVAAAAAVLTLCVGLFGSIALRSGDDVAPARLVAGGVLVGAGVLVLTVAGFDPARLSDLLGPLLGTWALVSGALLLGARPAGAGMLRAGRVVR
ncbi:acyltransferase family protein [Pseudactinotalea suaedae]|uniref:acyltransferase family protein n=1 Tax=Pseudactinotalea suaedae TaxID=1524924 RepID=UPI0012E15F05|nr:acyltransferase [Pseudactinotalea suaedae]